MKKLILMAAVMLSVLPAAAQEQASKFDASYIQVWGQAEKEITPDEFYLSVTINEKDSKGKISIQTQERAMLDALKKLGVDTQKQLRVVDMSSEYFKKGNALAWKQFQLKLNTPEQVAQVFGSLNDLGISNVSMEKVTHSQLDQYKNEVRIAAMKSAQTNAQTLAGAIGQKAGKCFYIYDSNNDVVPYYGNVFMARSMKAAVANDAAEAARAKQPDWTSRRSSSNTAYKPNSCSNNSGHKLPPKTTFQFRPGETTRRAVFKSPTDEKDASRRISYGRLHFETTRNDASALTDSHDSA